MKSSTENRHQQRANEVIDYISANLHRPLQLDVIAQRVNLSQRQLLRIMRSVLGEPLQRYVVRQRVERAVLYMQTENMNLTRLSEMVGYESGQSFSKAFKRQFGVSPKAYMNMLRSRLTKSCGDGSSLTFEVCEFEGLKLLYIRIFGKYGDEDNCTAAWSKLTKYLKSNDAVSPTTRYVGLSFDDPNVTSESECRFYACASVDSDFKPSGEYGIIELPRGKYAVYTHTGEYSELQRIYNKISLDFPFTMRHGVAFEEYIGKVTKIYIPIK